MFTTPVLAVILNSYCIAIVDILIKQLKQMEYPFIANMRIRKIHNGQMSDMNDQLAVEEPLEIQLLSGNTDNRVQKAFP